PDTFESQLLIALHNLSQMDPDWGVAGAVGVNDYGRGKFFVGHVNDRGTEIGSYSEYPRVVETLDELMLITRGDFKFDENIPSNHFYGADICLQARRQGRRCYAIEAYCDHYSATSQGKLPDDFWVAAEYMK